MMGSHNSPSSLFTYSVNLEKRVRANHPLRQLSKALGNLEWVLEEVSDCYGRNGHVSVDPRVLVKMMVLLFWDNVPSERELMTVIAERLDYLWFLGYTLDDEVPNHSVLSKARARWGPELFEKLFVRSVGLCLAAGLVDGGKLHLDSSLIKAHASRDSVISAAPELIAALRAACAREEQKLEGLPKKGVNLTHVSETDPAATLARKGAKPSELSYKHHRAVDDRQGVITAIVTTTGSTHDASQLPALVEQHQQITGTQVQTVIADSHYGTAENYRQCQSQNIKTHCKSCQALVEERGLIPVSQFHYDSDQDRYQCPAGHFLYYHNFKKDDGLIEYRISSAEHCLNCPLRPQCTKGAQGRTVTRPIFSLLVQSGREQASSASARKDLRRRKHLMEGSFADAANNHGFKRARWRGLWRQNIQNALIAAVQNIRLWMRGQLRTKNCILMRVRKAFALFASSYHHFYSKNVYRTSPPTPFLSPIYFPV
jgi:transposase